MTSQQTHVIVGASLAGAKAAETLRSEGFDGRVVLIGDEAEQPYERPPLSKDLLRGEVGPEKARVHDEGFYAEHDIELVLGHRVTGIAPGAGLVTLDGRDSISYDALLLATGAEPRRLGIPGAQLDGVHVLRSLDDSRALQARLDEGGHAVIVGAGWIGCEVAASARMRGLEVTVVEPQRTPLERVLGTRVGGIYGRLHEAHGVHMVCGEGVEAFEGDGRVERVRTSSGAILDCSFVVVGVGVTPRVELATEAALEVDNGIAVDAALRASAPGVYAAGDVASAEHPLYGGRRVRVEHWANALNQGPAAARSMLGQEVSSDRVPYFFSDQYDSGMEYRGHTPDGFDDVVLRGDPDSGEYLAFWLHEGVVQAAMNVNIWDAGDDLAALVALRRPVDTAALADAGTPLGQLTGAPA